MTLNLSNEERIRRYQLAPNSNYRIVRMFRDSGRNYTIARNLTLKEAQEHCNNPNSSSSTCTGKTGKARTRKCGPWFDGYTDK
jgi:hypothetical protein